MSDADNTEKEEVSKEKAADTQPQEQADSNAHPICQNAPNQEKCEEFAERLGEASDNIDKK